MVICCAECSPYSVDISQRVRLTEHASGGPGVHTPNSPSFYGLPKDGLFLVEHVARVLAWYILARSDPHIQWTFTNKYQHFGTLLAVPGDMYVTARLFTGCQKTGCIRMEVLHVRYVCALMSGVYPIYSGHTTMSTTTLALSAPSFRTIPQKPVFIVSFCICLTCVRTNDF